MVAGAAHDRADGGGELLARLGEELDQFDDDITAETLLDVTADTPLAPTARRLVDEGVDLRAEAQVTGLQKFNLVLALLVVSVLTRDNAEFPDPLDPRNPGREGARR